MPKLNNKFYNDKEQDIPAIINTFNSDDYIYDDIINELYSTEKFIDKEIDGLWSEYNNKDEYNRSVNALKNTLDNKEYGIDEYFNMLRSKGE